MISVYNTIIIVNTNDVLTNIIMIILTHPIIYNTEGRDRARDRTKDPDEGRRTAIITINIIAILTISRVAIITISRIALITINIIAIITINRARDAVRSAGVRLNIFRYR